MKRKLTVKELWILGYLRDFPGATLKQIEEHSPIDEAKSQRWNDESRTRGNDRVDWRIPSIEYATAQQSVVRLLNAGLVRREPEQRRPQDPPYAHFFVQFPESDDPLEALLVEEAHRGT